MSSAESTSRTIRDGAPNGVVPLWRALRVQLRVIGALLMREVITRYGRHNIGFLWLLMEPVVFSVGVVVLWNLLRGMHGFRVEVTPFIVTGYASLLLWRTCSFRGLKAIEPNRSLLHHRFVKIQDIFFARMLLELAGVTAAFIVLVTAMVTLELMKFPKDVFLLTAGWLLMAWFSACLGTILGCLSEYTDLVERLWHPVSYFLLAVSGAFFMVDWLPAGAQEAVLWVPMVHPIEMMRAGYWGDSPQFHFSVPYIGLVCLAMSLLALVLMADRRIKMMS
jgi:capsular polysaccharide transport system permease protein